MSSNNEREDVRRYFTEDEWSKMPEFMKLRCVNIKENYDAMVAAGLHPPVPYFMAPKPTTPGASEGSKSRKSGTGAAALLGPSVFGIAGGLPARNPQPATQKPTEVRRPEVTKPRQDPKSACSLQNATATNSDKDESTPGTSSAGARYPKRSRVEINYAENYVVSDDEDTDPDFSLSSEDSAPRGRKTKTRDTSSKPTSSITRPAAAPTRCKGLDPAKCPAHGPSWYADNTMSSMELFEQARQSLPEGLVIQRSRLRGAQLGVFARAPLGEKVCFGPYRSQAVENNDENPSTVESQRGIEGLLAANGWLRTATWMRYVNCAPTAERENLLTLHKNGAVYYTTSKKIGADEELLVCCYDTVP